VLTPRKITRVVQRDKNHNPPRKKSTDSMRNLAAGAVATASAGVEFSQVSASVAISSPNEDICSGRPAFFSAMPLSASSQCAKI